MKKLFVLLPLLLFAVVSKSFAADAEGIIAKDVQLGNATQEAYGHYVVPAYMFVQAAEGDEIIVEITNGWNDYFKINSGDNAYYMAYSFAGAASNTTGITFNGSTCTITIGKGSSKWQDNTEKSWTGSDMLASLKANGLKLDAYKNCVATVKLKHKNVNGDHPLLVTGSLTPKSYSHDDANYANNVVISADQFSGVGTGTISISINYTGDFGYCQFRIGDQTFSCHDWPCAGPYRTWENNGTKQAWIDLPTSMNETIKTYGLKITGSKNDGDLVITAARYDTYHVSSIRNWYEASAITIKNNGSGVSQLSTNAVNTVYNLTADVAGIYHHYYDGATHDEYGTASNSRVHWESDNTGCATVDGGGKVTVVGNGRATITATSFDNHNVTKTVQVVCSSDLVNIHVVKSGVVDANRQFKILVPATDEKGRTNNLQDVPVVISLHGGGGHYNDYSVQFTQDQVNAGHFIVIFPEGTYNSTRGNGWDATIRNTNKDIEFMEAIVNAMKNSQTKSDGNGGSTNNTDYDASKPKLSDYASNVAFINPNKIYICGWSNGGMMAYQTMAALPNMFAAGASTGGFPFHEFHLLTTGSMPSSFLHIHGESDEALPIEKTFKALRDEKDGNGNIIRSWYEDVTPSYVLDIRTHLDNIAFRSGCYPKAKQTTVPLSYYDRVTKATENNSYIKYEFKPVPDGSAVPFEYHYVKKMGHTAGWDAFGYDVPDQMWNFFKDREIQNRAQTIKFRAILKSSQYRDYLDKPADYNNDTDPNGRWFDIREHGWTINGYTKVKNASGEFVQSPANPTDEQKMVIAAYGEGKTDRYYQNTDDATKNWWASDNPFRYHTEPWAAKDNNGNFCTPYDYIGESNRNIYHSLQLEGNRANSLRFKTSSTNGDVVEVQIYRLVPGERDQFGNPVSYTKSETGLIDAAKTKYYANTTVTVNFTTPDVGWSEYYVEIKKANLADDTVVEFVEIYEGTLPATAPFFFDVTKAIPDDLQLVRQPVYGRRVGDQAREYFVFADQIQRHGNGLGDVKETIYKTIGDVSSIAGGSAYMGTLAQNKTVAVIGKEANGTVLNYTINGTDGLWLSQHGAARFEEHVTNYNAASPAPLTRGVVAFKVAGTMDFTIYFKTKNLGKMVETTSNGNVDHNSTLRMSVYYMNDMMTKPERFELPFNQEHWNIGNTNRYDVGNEHGANSLGVAVRLQHLGKDGSCFLYFAYEGAGGGRYQPTKYCTPKFNEYGIWDQENGTTTAELWVQGFMIKRPDLKVSIGRTDGLFHPKDADGNITDYNSYVNPFESTGKTDVIVNNQEGDVKCSPFGQNKPYVWSFGDNRFIGKHKASDDNIKEDVDSKKNQTDNRTYICGLTKDMRTGGTADVKLDDHVLVYSENPTSFGHFVAATDNEPAHIQFDTPSQIRYKRAINNAGDLSEASYVDAKDPGAQDVNFDGEGSPFDPVVNDALKVNVTGSGWFKVTAKVPYHQNEGDQHAVKMTIMSCPNYGNDHIRLLRYFKMPADGKYHDYVVFLKARESVDKPNKPAEATEQSLFVVFEDIGDDIKSTVPGAPDGTGVWDGDKNGFQVNICEMQWLNDEVPDYVFQREQYLFKSQTTNEKVHGHVSSYSLQTRQQYPEDATPANTVLYWQAGGAHKKAAVMLQSSDDTWVPKLMDEGSENEYVTAPPAVDQKVAGANLYEEDGTVSFTMRNGSTVTHTKYKKIASDDSALEDGRWAYDKNWMMVSGGTNPKSEFTTTTTTTTTTTSYYSKYGLLPDRGNLASKMENGEEKNPNAKFGGFWDMAAMPTFGLQDLVNNEKGSTYEGYVDHPNTDYIYERNHYGSDKISPLWQGAHTEKQSPRIDNRLSKFTWSASQETDGEDTDEFNLPVSGPFFRFMPMKNVKITAYVVPGNTSGSIYVLDESGKIIKNNSDVNSADWKIYGSVDAENYQTFANGLITPKSQPNAMQPVQNRAETVKITISARAGKEYFLTSKGMAIGIAAMYFDQIPETGDGSIQNRIVRYTNEATNMVVADVKDNGNIQGTIVNPNNSAVGDSYEQYTDVVVKRAFKANKWQSLVLPFSLNEAKLEEVFGEGTQCLHYEKVEGNRIYLLHHRYNMVVAGRPIFIKPTKALDSGFTIKNVTLQAKEVTGYDDEDPNGYRFVGDFNPSEMPTGSIVMTMPKDEYAGQLKYTSKYTATNGLRSWIQLKNPPAKGQQAAPRLLTFASYHYNGSLLDTDDTGISTDIEELFADMMGDDTIVVRETAKVYDMNGRAVGTAAEFDKLPAGIYIVNGKKIVK